MIQKAYYHSYHDIIRCDMLNVKELTKFVTNKGLINTQFIITIIKSLNNISQAFQQLRFISKIIRLWS